MNPPVAHFLQTSAVEYQEQVCMHEMSVAQNILEIVHQYVPEGDGHLVKRVRLTVGELSGILPDSLSFCFTALTQGTPLAGARLEIEQTPLTARCHSCTVTSHLEYGLFLCPSCGSADITVLSGSELQVTELEIDDNCGATP
jgi:hydrogenase nickel incorporation protein HypA/HybF